MTIWRTDEIILFPEKKTNKKKKKINLESTCLNPSVLGIKSNTIVVTK